MTKYIALLRGISPTNPKMRNEKIRKVFEGLGLKNVTSVLSSGNIIFETARQASGLEKTIEEALRKDLDIISTTIIRSDEQLQQLIKKNPFGTYKHSTVSYLTVTFLKNSAQLRFPKQYPTVAVFDREVCCVIDTTDSRQPDPIVWLEKTYGKEITTRTWKTVERILEKMK